MNNELLSEGVLLLKDTAAPAGRALQAQAHKNTPADIPFRATIND